MYYRIERGTMKAEPKLTIVPAETEHDPDLGLVEETPRLIPEGLYTVGYVRCSPKYRIGGSDERVSCTFRITDPGEYFEVELDMAIALTPQKGKKKMAASAKLTRLAQVAFEGELMPRKARLLPSTMFKGKLFIGRVETVKKDYFHKAIPRAAHYSKLDMLMEKVAG
jgi:hypothetical protein